LALLIPLTLVLAFGSLTAAGAKAPQGVALWSPGDPDPTYPFSDRYPVVVVTATEEEARAAAESGIDVESVGLRDGQWVVQANVNDSEHSALAGEGHEVYRLRNLALEMHRSLPEGDRDWTNWPTFTEFEAELQSIAADHPNICRLISIGQSVQGRDLWFLKISDNPDTEEFEPEFKYSSTMHGDEVVGMDLCVRLANLLTDEYGSDPTITSYVNGIEIWICPLHNPDGYVNGTLRQRNRNLDLPAPQPGRLRQWDPVQRQRLRLEPRIP
jgi:carboxypeptidase D